MSSLGALTRAQRAKGAVSGEETQNDLWDDDEEKGEEPEEGVMKPPGDLEFSIPFGFVPVVSEAEVEEDLPMSRIYREAPEFTVEEGHGAVLPGEIKGEGTDLRQIPR
jgi:hypothetical protein